MDEIVASTPSQRSSHTSIGCAWIESTIRDGRIRVCAGGALPRVMALLSASRSPAIRRSASSRPYAPAPAPAPVVANDLDLDLGAMNIDAGLAAACRATEAVARQCNIDGQASCARFKFCGMIQFRFMWLALFDVFLSSVKSCGESHRPFLRGVPSP